MTNSHLANRHAETHAPSRSVTPFRLVALITFPLTMIACQPPASESAAIDTAEVSANAILSNESDGRDWPAFGRTYDEGHYSPLDLINGGNVERLGLAWSYDLPPSASAVSAPLAIDGKLYVASGLSQVRAFDAATGRELWMYDPQVAEVAGDRLKSGWGIRGLAWWDGRLFVGTQDGRLIAIDATSGKLLWSAQTTAKDSGLYITGAPRVFHGRVIIGNGGADFGPVRGYVTAYDGTTGQQLWRFYTVPGDPAKEPHDPVMAMAAKTWKGDFWKRGGGGTVWNAITYDPVYDRIYLGTGNGSPWNQKIRSPGGGDNLFLCSIVALDAKTGAYVWHYQTNPGETWDMNSAMDITLATLPVDGRPRRVILHAPKNGFFYIIDRKTGKLISAKPFANKVTWAKGIDEATGRPIEDPAARYPNGEALIWPGSTGAHGWHPMSYSPKAGLVFIPTNEVPGYYSDRTINPKTWQPEPHMSLNGGVDPILTAGPPPRPGQSFSHLQAWDPSTQTRRWSIPLPGALNGGVMSTAGNLVFQGRVDGQFVAYAADSGKRLWSFAAQNAVVAPPITYMAGGQQYVTVLASYGGGPATMGPLSAQFGWTYRTQARRVLTFRIGGKAKLPPRAPIAALEPIADTEPMPDAAAIKRGGLNYFHNCMLCHGVAGIAGGNAPDLRESGFITDKDNFRQIVHDGLLEPQGMPRFGYFGEVQLEEIRAYLRERARDARSRAK